MDIEKKRKELEYHRVLTAKMDLELKALEFMEQIKRIEDNIKIQDAKLEELKAELAK
jgi:hypothetical protein